MTGGVGPRDEADDETILEESARALVARLAGEGADHGPGNDADMAESYRALVLQEGVDRQPPILHTLLANYHTGGTKDILPRAAAALSPTLEELYTSGPITKNVVLMLLLLRESLGPWADQTRVSQLHLEWVDQLTMADLTLPYSCMFDPVSFRRNRDDIVELVSSPTHTEVRDRLPLEHLVFFAWLTGERTVGDGDGLRSLLESRLQREDRSEDAIAAARTLLARHDEAPLPTTGPLADVVDAASFEELRTRAKEIRRRLQPESAGGSTSVAAASERRLASTRWQAANAALHLARGRVPVRVPGRRRSRVAVCVSGQLRGYRQAFPTWERSLLRSVDHDLFVHTWTAIGRSGAEPYRSVLPFAGERFTDAYRVACHEVGFEEVQSRYPALFRGVTASARTDERELAAFYRTDHVVADDDSHEPFASMTNPEKMHTKLEACDELMRSSGREYDLVVRIRPDKPIKMLAYSWTDLVEVCRAGPTVFADHAMGVHYAYLLIGDQFAVGSPATMEVYAHTWSLYPALPANGLFRCSEEFAGHSSLAQVCWLHGIDVRKAPVRFGPLLEAAPVGSDTILQHVTEGAEGRMDEVDRALLAAINADLGAK